MTIGLGLFMLLGGPSIGLWILSTQVPDPSFLAESIVRAEFAKPVTVTDDQHQAVSVQLTWDDPVKVLWPGAEGILTRVDLHVGTMLESGSLVGEVSGQQILALATRRPIYRDLQVGDSGDDVQMIVEEFIRLGYLPEDALTDRVTSAVAAVFAEINSLSGRRSRVLEYRTVAWLPAQQLLVSSAEISVGQPAPALGVTIAKDTPNLASAIVSAPGGGKPTPLASEGFLEVPWAVIGIDKNMTVAQGDLSLLASGVTPETETIDLASIRLRDPIMVAQLPASAVVTGTDGATCVYGSDMTPHVVEVSSGAVGRATFPIKTNLPDLVLINPGAVSDLHVCRGE